MAAAAAPFPNTRITSMDPEELSVRYYGNLAATYDAEREGTPLWQREHAAVREILTTIRPRSIIDVPVGTGRFLPLYRELGITPAGADISTEMLQAARRKAQEVGVLDVTLHQADIRKLPYPDRSFDAALCMRFLNWLDAEDLCSAVEELARVSRRYLILGLRSYAPASEIKLLSARSLIEHSLQLKRRFYQWRTHQTFIYHRAAAVQRMFERSSLVIVNKIRIKTKHRGFDYSVYLCVRR